MTEKHRVKKIVKHFNNNKVMNDKQFNKSYLEPYTKLKKEEQIQLLEDGLKKFKLLYKDIELDELLDKIPKEWVDWFNQPL